MESSSSTTRTRTHSALKWMANERAAVAGELQALRKTLEVLRSREALLASQLDALDMALVRFDEDLNPADIRAVNAWKERNGGRGQKQAFFLAVLGQAGDAGLTALAIQELWAYEVGDLSLLAPKVRELVRENQTAPVLKRLRQKGLVVCEPIPGGGHNDFVWKLVPQPAKKSLPV